MRLALPALLATSLALPMSGCFVVSDGPLNALRDSGQNSDGGNDMSTSFRPADRCDQVGPLNTIGVTTVRIPIDTTQGFTANTDILCGTNTSPGRDAFIGLDVSAGELWHFHLHYLGGGTSRNPLVYVVDDSCNDRMCAAVGNACNSSADEHFAFTFPTTGRWRVGIDDVNGDNEGANYEISIYKLTCGDGVQTHGENCDYMAPGVVNCSNTCRRLLATSPIAETEPNDTPPEAEILDFLINDPSGVQEVTGNLTASDCYPDIFEFTLQTARMFRASALSTAGTACTGTMAPYTIDLRLPNGQLTPGGLPPCPVLAPPTMLNAGRYTVEVRGMGTTTPYRIRFEFL